jgi:hypothetical protein
LRVVEPEFETGNRRGRFKNEFWKLGNLYAKTLRQSLLGLGRRLETRKDSKEEQ